jgi:hypothetical protein
MPTVFTDIFFFGGGFSRLESGHRDVPYFYDGINLRNPKIYLRLLNLSLGVSGVA